jgi:transcriptional regulator with XRE-family HTH domain
VTTDQPAPFGELLRTYRQRAQLSQSQLAIHAGLSVATIAHLERGQRLPRPGLVQLLAAALGLAGAERDAFLASAVPDRGSSARIFVSHSHQDETFTARLVSDLRAAGATVWVDVSDMQYGDFMARINEGLANSEWMVLVLSPDALRSPAVRAEVNAAFNLFWHQQMRGIIPVIAMPSDPNDIPPTWRTLHFYDASRDYDSALSDLLIALGLGAS